MRGRLEEKANAIVQMETDVREAWAAEGQDPDLGPMELVSAIATSILTDDIETIMDMLVGLQSQLKTDVYPT